MALSPVLMRPRSRIVGPVPVSGLGLWLDASNGASLTFNGNTVSEWRDLSGNNRHFSQATAALQPNGVSRTYNGLRVLDFDGTQLLEGNTTSLSAFRRVTAMTVVMFAKYDTRVADNAVAPNDVSRLLYFSTGDESLDQARLLLSQVAGLGFGMRSRYLDAEGPEGWFRDVRYGLDAALSSFVVSAVTDFENSSNRIYENGVLQAQTSGWASTGATPDTDSKRAAIGGRRPDALEGLDGFIGEMLIYRRALGDYQRSLVEQYLLAKWNPQPEPAAPVVARSLWNVETLEPVYHWSL